MLFARNVLLFLEMVSKLDESVGRIVHALGEKGMLRDSLILFLTDNGAASIGRYRNYGSNYPLRGVRLRTVALSFLFIQKRVEKVKETKEKLCKLFTKNRFRKVGRVSQTNGIF